MKKPSTNWKIYFTMLALYFLSIPLYRFFIYPKFSLLSHSIEVLFELTTYDVGCTTTPFIAVGINYFFQLLIASIIMTTIFCALYFLFKQKWKLFLFHFFMLPLFLMSLLLHPIVFCSEVQYNPKEPVWEAMPLP
jgi:hypothetical protein